jgi:MoaE-MoaD fusion protein
MVTTVRLFAGLKERAGAPSVDVELPDGATVADLLAALRDTPVGPIPDRSAIVAVNREYADGDVVISAGDEVALIPPVSGGAVDRVRLVAVMGDPIDIVALREAVRDPGAGAVVIFEGTTRTVAFLDYEAYESMASERMAQIAAEEAERHSVCAVAVAHRIGRVPLSEPSVVIAVSAPHRGEAFAAARAVIDRVKAEAPIWKREEEAWVEGTLPPQPGRTGG